MNNRIVVDYNIPNLVLEKSIYGDYKLGKYGRMRLHYLKEHKRAEYTILIMNSEFENIYIILILNARNNLIY